jgi:hypothetical protein
MERDYTVELALETAQPLSEDGLMEVAQIGGAAGGNVGGRRLETTLTVTAPTASAAIDKALTLVLAKVDGSVASVSALTTEEFDRREDARALLVGVGEAAAMLGISKQRVNVLSKRQDFPAPLARLGSGPVWRGGDLSTFAEGWQRKGGRPPKAGAIYKAKHLAIVSARGSTGTDAGIIAMANKAGKNKVDLASSKRKST